MIVMIVNILRIISMTFIILIAIRMVITLTIIVIVIIVINVVTPYYITCLLCFIGKLWVSM